MRSELKGKGLRRDRNVMGRELSAVREQLHLREQSILSLLDVKYFNCIKAEMAGNVNLVPSIHLSSYLFSSCIELSLYKSTKGMTFSKLFEFFSIQQFKFAVAS